MRRLCAALADYLANPVSPSRNSRTRCGGQEPCANVGFHFLIVNSRGYFTPAFVLLDVMGGVKFLHGSLVCRQRPKMLVSAQQERRPTQEEAEIVALAGGGPAAQR